MTYNLHDRLGYKLTLAAQVNNQLLVNLLSQLNLTRQMWCVLVAVGEQQLSQPSDIADYIGIQRAAVSRTLKDMHNKGLLQRISDPQNGKQTLVNLTLEGQALLAQSLLQTEQSTQRLNTKLNDSERQELDRLLSQYLSGPMDPPSRI
ncbi:MAG TPA: hypothetical protein DE179_05430 [Oceanospirillaceae bacterium]|nr:hypothetical protein [Oceanospirillaceae bacterium]